MKKVSYLVTSLLLVSSLEARENPFMPTQAYQDEVARLMEIDQNYSREFIGGDKNIETEDMTPVLRENEVNKPAETAVAKSEEEIMAEQKKKEEELAKQKALDEALMKAKMAKELAEKERLEKEKAIARAKELEERGPVVFVKQRDDIEINNTIEVLPFLTVNYTNDEMTLTTKYPVFKKFYLEEENKLIVDFKGDVTFYTKRHDLESTNFKSLAAGNHKDEKFFRVVILVDKEPSKYNVSYNDQSVFITLNKE